ncbi:MAG TPA: ABC transporter permease [Phycisphaerales bacterium]|nr:ABC transporter permease [Phycisphaerales bacterium]
MTTSATQPGWIDDAAAREPSLPMHRVGAGASWAEALDPVATARSLWRARGLLSQFARRDVEARNRGSVLGILWTLLNPLVMLAVYTFVFAVVWEARWEGTGAAAGAGEKTLFAITLFAGIIAYEVFAATVNSAPLVIVHNPNFVKRVVFPLEVLPLSTLLASLAVFACGMAVLIAANLALRGGVSGTIWLTPIVLLPLVLTAGGIALLVSALGVFLRDIKPVVGVLTQVLFFTTPILYPASKLAKAPDWMRAVLSANPLTPIFEGVRDVMVFGRYPDFAGLAVSTLVGVAIFQAGRAVFTKLKRGFADVI